MINSVQETALTLASNTANIPFSSDVVRTRSANCCGGWLNHSIGSTQYQLIEPGIYEIIEGKVDIKRIRNVEIIVRTIERV